MTTPPSIRFRMRIKLRRFYFTLKFYDGYTLEIYDDEKKAKEAFIGYKKLSNLRVGNVVMPDFSKLKLIGNTLRANYKGKLAMRIYEDTIENLRKMSPAQLRNPLISIKYELID